MSDFKEFQGKDLDEAIESACDYFNLKRDRLEIEILSGGSSGIFGIMGVKKAKVKARARAQVNASDILNGKTEAAEAPKETAKPKAKAKPKAEPKPEPKPEPMAEPGNMVEPGNRFDDEIDYEELDSQVNGNVIEPEVDYEALDDEVNGNVDPELMEKPKQKAKRERKPRDKKPREDRPREDRPREERSREDRPREERSREDRSREDRPRKERKPRDKKPREQRPEQHDEQYMGDEERPRANMDEFDPEVLTAATREVMTELLRPIVGECKLEITIETDRVKVFIDDEENSGLLIGREGQTLSSLQYLVNRLVSRKMEASIRVQVDTGDYRERQDDKLRQIADHLAEKAADLGRTQSTKPLSSYHRRVVHLALQEHEEVFTRSKGDGPMKRVLIVPKSRKTGRSRR